MAVPARRARAPRPQRRRRRRGRPHARAFDHLGFAERARRELGVPVHVHESDVPLTKHPWRYDHERPRSWYRVTQVDALPIVAALVRHRAWFAAPVKRVERFENGTLPVPGEPRALQVQEASHASRWGRLAMRKLPAPGLQRRRGARRRVRAHRERADEPRRAADGPAPVGQPFEA